jgi:hypothetical protein
MKEDAQNVKLVAIGTETTLWIYSRWKSTQDPHPLRNGKNGPSSSFQNDNPRPLDGKAVGFFSFSTLLVPTFTIWTHTFWSFKFPRRSYPLIPSYVLIQSSRGGDPVSFRTPGIRLWQCRLKPNRHERRIWSLEFSSLLCRPWRRRW